MALCKGIKVVYKVAKKPILCAIQQKYTNSNTQSCSTLHGSVCDFKTSDENNDFTIGTLTKKGFCFDGSRYNWHVICGPRRMSESDLSPPAPPISPPYRALPDLVPAPRDRTHSTPDVRALERRRARRAAREVGAELRRLSDEFNASFMAGAGLSPVREEPTNPISGYMEDVFGSFVRAFGFGGRRFAFSSSRQRRSSSVDHGDQDLDGSDHEEETE